LTTIFEIKDSYFFLDIPKVIISNLQYNFKILKQKKDSTIAEDYFYNILLI